MTIRAAGYEKLIDLESELKDYTDTSFKFYDLGDLHRRLNSQPIHPITLKLREWIGRGSQLSNGSSCT